MLAEGGRGTLLRAVWVVEARSAFRDEDLVTLPRSMPAEGGRGTLLDEARSVGREACGRALSVGPAGLLIPGRPALSGADRTAPRFSKPAAFGGCGIEREAVALGSGVREVGAATGPRFDPPLDARSAPAFRPVSRAGRPATVGEAWWNEPRPPVGGARWLTTGRANACLGGTAVGCPAFRPSIDVRVGCTSGERTAVTRPSWFGATRTTLCCTGNELTSVLRETAVNPFGACRFEYRVSMPLCGSIGLGWLWMKLLL